YFLFAQEIQFSKNVIKKVLKNTTGNPLITDNTDSLFYKSDTVILYNNSKIKNSIGACEFVNISFEKSKNKFLINESGYCSEIGWTRIITEKHYFNLLIQRKKNKYFIEFKNNFSESYLFEVLKIIEIHFGQNNDFKAKKIVLKRIFD